MIQLGLVRRLAWGVALGFALLFGGCNAEPEPVEQRASALTSAEIRTIRFELLADWERYAGTGTLSSSTHRSEGERSLALSGMGYIAVRNQPFQGHQGVGPSDPILTLWDRIAGAREILLSMVV